MIAAHILDVGDVPVYIHHGWLIIILCVYVFATNIRGR